MKPELKEKIFSKIEKEKIEPISETYFENKNRALWFMIVVFVLLAILFGGFLWDDSIEFFSMGSMMRGNAGLFVLPHIFWTLLIIFLIFAGIKSFASTPTGHRNSYQMDILIGIIIILLGSYIFRWFGFGPQMHSFFVDHIPMVSSVLYDESSWDDAESGRLAGAIVSVDTSTLVLKSLDGKIWNVSIGDSFASPMVLGEVNEKVRILGKKIGDSTFQSERIMPWFGKGMMGKGSGSGGMMHGGGRGMMR